MNIRIPTRLCVGAAVALGLLLATGLISGAHDPPDGIGAIIKQLRAPAPIRTPTRPPPSPTTVGALTEAQVRAAIDLSASDVVSISFGASDAAGSDVFNTAASFFPTQGSSYFVMATGNTSSALMPNNSESTSTQLGGLNTTEGEDLVQVVLVLDPPANATCLAFDFAYYSEEFPEFVGSQFNDAFIAEIGQSTFQIVDDQVIAPNNFAFDTAGNVVSVNTVFGVTAGNAADTTYDGATPLLTAVTPLECTTNPPSGVMVAESEPNDDQAAANPIAIGDDYTAELNPASESDFVSFSASAGQSIKATTVLGTLTDTTLRLLTAGGAELAFNDDFGGGATGFESQIEFTLPAAGTYFLEVQSFGGCCAGTYTLELRGVTCGANNITITLSIMDLGDSIYDSAAFIDNFRWFFGLDCTPGADADSDGDALLDDWEINGIDFDNNGTVDLDLPAMGADPDHKDIFVEIDYMVLGGIFGHTHKPKAAALQTVIDAFNNAPVTNPDGINGIHIHIDAGSDTIMNPVTNALWGSLSESDSLAHQTDLGTGAYNWSAFDAIKGVGVPGSFSIERGDVFHYCIFAHDLSAGLGSTSGIARGIPSSDFIVSLGSWTGSVGTVNQQAGTLMHELGHNLTFRHGGNDNINFKPNYLSIMAYYFQTRGLRINGAEGNFDYSRFLLPSLNETDLDERIGLMGVAGAARYGTRFFDASGTATIVNDINGPIDWNGDGDGGADNSVMVDINNDGSFSTLGTSDNWDEIVYNGGAVGHLGEIIELPEETESNDIDEETDIEIPTELSVCIAGPGEVTLEACESETYLYTVTNTGDNFDIYDIAVSVVQTWADTSGLPLVLPLAAGASTTFEVPLTIPEGTPDGSADQLVISVFSMTNPLMQDAAETTTTTSSGDLDGDGLTDLCDACPDSDLAETIVIDGCDSGVPNMLFEDGCTMSDLIAECAEGAGNHGQFVSCVAQLTNDWKQQGLITGQEKGAIMSCAAQADIPPD